MFCLGSDFCSGTKLDPENHKQVTDTYVLESKYLLLDEFTDPKLIRLKTTSMQF
jgi:hypothetical protein